MELNFKFSIGQILTTKEAASAYELLNSKRTDADRSMDIHLGKLPGPLSLFILERRFQECSGGVQIQYLCRYFTARGYVEHIFNEIELVESPLTSS